MSSLQTNFALKNLIYMGKLKTRKRARSLVVRDLRLETKVSRFESGIAWWNEVAVRS